MVSAIRNIELALGDGAKQPTKAERQNMAAARKSIHTGIAIAAGEEITEDKLAMKRPGNGISPMQLQNVIGLKTKRHLPADHLLSFQDLCE